MPKRTLHDQIAPDLEDAALFMLSPDSLLALYTSEGESAEVFRHLVSFDLPSEKRHDLSRLLSRPFPTWPNPALIPLRDHSLRLVHPGAWWEEPRLYYLDLPENIQAEHNVQRGLEPVAAIRITPERSVEALNFRNTPFRWIDVRGRVLEEGRLPGRLAPRDSSSSAVRRTPDGSYWALPSCDQSETGYGDVPADDIRILRVKGGKASVIASVAAGHSLPSGIPDEWNSWISLSDDSHPAWLAGSDTLVYRLEWGLASDGSSDTPREALLVYELWARSLEGKQALLAVSATYDLNYPMRGKRYARWWTDPDGRLVGRSEKEPVHEGRWILVPYPALFGPEVAYLDRGRIVTLRVPSG